MKTTTIWTIAMLSSWLTTYIGALLYVPNRDSLGLTIAIIGCFASVATCWGHVHTHSK